MDFSKQHAWLAYYSKRCMQSVQSYTPVLRCELDSGLDAHFEAHSHQVQPSKHS